MTTYLSLVVLLPLAAVVWRSQEQGWSHFVHAIQAPESWAAVKLTLVLSVIVALVNLVMGTLIAWVLVRDTSPARPRSTPSSTSRSRCPRSSPASYCSACTGPSSPLGVDLAYARSGVLLALLFVTLPFVVRTVQPVLLELDRDIEDAAASLGAGR